MKDKNVKIIKEEIIEKLAGKKKFIILGYDRFYFDLSTIYAKDEDEAFEILEESSESNVGSEWLMEKKEFNQLKKLVNEFEV